MQSLPDTNLSVIHRRRWLQVAGVGWLGGVLSGRGRAGERPGRRSPPAIKSCIVIFHYGGPSQFETYDPKPLAPQGVRGEYAAISTSVPGVAVGEFLPRVAKIMHLIVPFG